MDGKSVGDVLAERAGTRERIYAACVGAYAVAKAPSTVKNAPTLSADLQTLLDVADAAVLLLLGPEPKA